MLSRSWVTTTKVRPSCWLRSRISSSSSTAETGSRPADGSSRKRRSGSSAMARAIPARLHMPPESSLGIRSSALSRPTRRSLAATMPPMASAGSVVQVCKGRAMFSPTVNDPSRAPDWNMTPNSGRPGTLWSGATPSMVTLPLIGVSRPTRYRSKVDFPQPLPPRMAKISPRSISKVASFCTTVSSQPMVRSTTLKSGSVIGPPPGRRWSTRRR